MKSIRAIVHVGTALACFLWFLPVTVSRAQVENPPASRSPFRTGIFTANFSEHHPDASLNDIYKYLEWQEAREAASLNKYVTLDSEEWTIYVPDDYRGHQKHGLLAVINPGQQGRIMRRYRSVYRDRNMIVAAAARSGNSEHPIRRAILALDGIHNLKQRYNHDPNRIYLTGISGGGRMTSMLGIGYAHVFSGAFPIIGCNYFKPIPAGTTEDGRKKIYRPSFSPRPNILKKAKEQTRYVLITGSEDFNRKQTRDIYEHGYQNDGFHHVKYIEVKGMGHVLPDSETIRKTFAFLDRPLVQKAKQKWNSIQNAIKSEQHENVLSQLQYVARYSFDQPWADQARNALDQVLAPVQKQWKTLRKTSIQNPDQTTGEKLRNLIDRYHGLDISELLQKRLKQVNLWRNAQQNVSNKNWTKALNQFRSLADRWPESAFAEKARKRAKTLREQSEVKTALQKHEQESNAKRLWQTAENLRANNLHDQAQKLYRKIIEQYPDTSYADKARTIPGVESDSR